MYALIKWWLILELLGLIGLPIVAWLFPKLKDKGTSLGILTGLVVVAYPVWLLSHWGPLFGPGLIVSWLLGFGVLAVLLFSLERKRWKETLKKPWELLASKGVWLLAFFGFAYLRAHNADIVGISNWGGCEKFMDLNFVNGILGSSQFPPGDNWLAGFPINYYYYGYYLCAVLVNLTGVLPHVGYNLMLVTVYALAVHGAWGLLRNLGVRWYWAVLGIYIAFLAANLKAGTLAFSEDGILPHQAMGTSRVIDLPNDHTINEYPLFSFSWGDLHGHLSGMALQMGLLGLCWGAVVSFSAVSVLRQVCAIALTAVFYGSLVVTNAWDLPAFAVIMLFSLLSATSLRKDGHALLIALLALVGGVILVGVSRVGIPLPLILLILLGAGGFLLFRSQESHQLKLGGHLVLRFAAVLSVFAVLFRPFFSYFVPPTSGHNNVPWDLKSPIVPFLLIFGVHLSLLALPLLAQLVRYLLETIGGEKKEEDTPKEADPVAVVRWTALSLLLVGWVLGAALLVKKAGSLQTALTPILVSGFLALGFLWLFQSWLRRIPTEESDGGISAASQRFVSLLLILALGLILGCEFVAVKDFYGENSLRFNTVFKFHLQAWLLLSLAIAFTCDLLFRRFLVRFASGTRYAGLFAVPLLLQSLLILGTVWWTGAGTVAFLKVMSSDFEREPTLDGLDYAYDPKTRSRDMTADDANAILWLLDEQRFNPDPDRKILEVPGDPYSIHGRVSAFTGIPTLVGWPNHEGIWNRGNEEALRENRLRDREAKEIYRTPDFKKSKELLEKHEITHVFWGNVERREFGASAVRKFKKYMNEAKAFGETIVFSGYRDIPIADTELTDVPAKPLSGARAIQDPEHPLVEPRGVACGPDDSIYVCNSKSGTVSRFDSEGKWIQDYGSPGNTPGTGELSTEYSGATGVAVDSEGTVFVADTWNHRIAVFSPDGTFDREMKLGFFGPRDLVFHKGKLVLSDTGHNRVLVLSISGTIERTIGQKGDGEGQFVEPVGLAAVGDNLYVADVGNGRIQVFGPNYAYRFSFGVLGWEDQVWTEPYMTVDSKNNLWVTDSGASRLERFSSQGKLTGIYGPDCNPIGNLKTTKGIAWGGGNLILSDFGNQRIVICPVPE